MSNDNELTSCVLRGLNRLRIEMGLPLIVYKKTNCLKCQSEFISRNYPHVRLCGDCKDLKEWKTGLSNFDVQQKLRLCTPASVAWSETPLINEEEKE